jgi:photosystem II stability/assembly factor-like uncharacterized protein
MRIERYFILLMGVMVFAISGLGCRSLSHPLKAPERPIPPPILDPDWSFIRVSDPLPALTNGRIKCNANKLCWSWNEHNILVSENGASWRQFYSSTSQRLSSVCLLSSGSGWIVADSNLYFSDDAGVTLRQISVADKSEEIVIRSVFFGDNDHGWVSGGQFAPLQKDDPIINSQVTRGKASLLTIYETTDRGATWQRQALPRRVGTFNEIHFWNSMLGVASERTYLFMTRDGGDHWVDLRKELPTIESDLEQTGPAQYQSGFFLDQQKGWFLFSDFEFEAVVTRNGGKPWKKVTWKAESSSQDSASYPPPVRFVFVDELNGLMVYSHSDGGELFKTSDGGRNWEAIYLLKPHAFYDIFSGEAGTFLVGSEGIYSVKRITRP